MASTYGSPVAFTKEKNVWTLAAKVQFGASGAVTLDTNNSKGICAAWNESVAFTGGTTNSTTTLGSISSFDGLFFGMTVVGPAGELQSSTTISSFSAAGKSVTLSKQAITTDATATYNATGGRYRFQFGQQAGLRLDPYVKLMGVEVRFDVTTGSAGGNATQLQLAPSAPVAFVVDNLSSTRTVPTTLATSSTDASVAIQFGYGQGPGTGFVATAPADGEIARVVFIFGNSTAP